MIHALDEQAGCIYVIYIIKKHLIYAYVICKQCYYGRRCVLITIEMR